MCSTKIVWTGNDGGFLNLLTADIGTQNAMSRLAPSYKCATKCIVKNHRGVCSHIDR